MVSCRYKILLRSHNMLSMYRGNYELVFYDFNLSPESNLSSRVIEFVRVKFEQPIFDTLVNFHIIKRGQCDISLRAWCFEK